jgi:rubrerythrin
MPEFLNPFTGTVTHKMNNSDLVRAIMLNIAAELEAVHLYTAHMDATDNADAKKVLYDIALEELVHAGEFTALLYRLDPIAATKAQEGFTEVQELLGGVKQPESPSGDGNGKVQIPIPQGLTVGSLIGK